MLGSSSDIYFVISWILQKTLAEGRGVVDNVAEERVEVEEEEEKVVLTRRIVLSPFPAH